ncbi:MAG: hypothetical protein QG576_472 [Bacteroidota bacterium]|nr:hypothetical protein [Bacteroidota bacterium]
MRLSFPFAARVFRFYYDGFREMSQWGRRVWIIILIKLFIIFIILKVFFFRDFLSEKYDNDAQKSEYVLNQITNSNYTDD